MYIIIQVPCVFFLIIKISKIINLSYIYNIYDQALFFAVNFFLNVYFIVISNVYYLNVYFDKISIFYNSIVDCLLLLFCRASHDSVSGHFAAGF